MTLIRISQMYLEMTIHLRYKSSAISAQYGTSIWAGKKFRLAWNMLSAWHGERSPQTILPWSSFSVAFSSGLQKHCVKLHTMKRSHHWLSKLIGAVRSCFQNIAWAVGLPLNHRLNNVDGSILRQRWRSAAIHLKSHNHFEKQMSEMIHKRN